MPENGTIVAGVDVGTECVKVVILEQSGGILGRAVVPTRGYFQERAREAMDAALDDAEMSVERLASICATGFGANLVSGVALNSGETACHALGAWHHNAEAMSVVDIGGREPRVIHVDGNGIPISVFTLRQCALGIGAFLMYAARHLDVHPTRLQELAADASSPAPVSSYCSVFASSEILERLREGNSREEVALGCMHSIAERIVEMGGFKKPLKVTGGVAEYFPGVLAAMAEITGLKVDAVPEPIMIGALGAALKALHAVESAKT